MSWFNKKQNADNAGDDHLLESYRQTGDLVFLGHLFEKYTPLIFGVCLKYLHDEERSKDAVMQIFEELINKAKNFEIKNFKSWLYVLSRNYCLMQLRAGGRFEQINVDDVMESAMLMHPEDAGNEEYLKALERCMQKLNTTQQRTIDLFYLQEKSYREITDETGFSLNEVKSFIQNGKRNLKICLEKNNGR